MQQGQSPSARSAMTAAFNSSGTAFFYGGRTPIDKSPQTYVRKFSKCAFNIKLTNDFSSMISTCSIATRLLGSGLISDMAGERHHPEATIPRY